MKTKVSEIKIVYRSRVKLSEAPKIKSSATAADVLYSNWDKDEIEVSESFKLLLLNNNNRVKGIFEVSRGGITYTLVDLRLIFGVILKSLSTAVILCHNHPSGTLLPSNPDKDLTRKIKNAAGLFDIKVLDHLILTPGGDYYSFADNGML
ncbi:JAB domain-containing protein [Zunongwangia sp. F363]|uniref:JAB domain-containing protein n=1 Tax=Autumnicola tepida TaxID=3075595 RepID=A0ABU3C4S2_9FLAO|nr:JAB domain-containing protein [Zunongwangia sp. F363]MDT0641345.1 JAB domain-containing protein [Zunongwangia sp. F363]